MRTKNKPNKYILPIIAIVLLLVAANFTITNLLPGSITSSDSTCDLTVLSIDSIQTASNEPTLNNEKAYLLNVRADKGNECINVQLTQADLDRYGIHDTLLGNLTISAKIQDMSLDYKIYDSNIALYKIYESTASSDLSGDIPYNLVSFQTTQLSANNKFSDPNGQAPTINHLGNFPAGGDTNLMQDIGEWAYVMPEASNIPLGKDISGNWWVTHMGGIPFYRGYTIDTIAYNKYKVLFTVTNDAGELLASATSDEKNKNVALSDFARIKFTGSNIESIFPPQPGTDFAIVQGLKGTPSDGNYKFVSKRRYTNYLNTMDELINFDNNYFVYSWSDMKGSLFINTTPSSDVYIDNKYLGFTPITINDIEIGRHNITAKKSGYFDAQESINLLPTTNKLLITLAKIPPPSIAISVTPSTIIEGRSASLSWTVTGVYDSVRLYDPSVSTIMSKSSKSVNPTQSTTYTIIASGVGGETTGATRLTVNLPPPPPPPVPVRRDPGVGRETLTDKENTLNNMLGLMYNENVAPEDCIINPSANIVSCKPKYPVAYPTFQIIIKASAITLQLNSGIPEITSVTPPSNLLAGNSGYLTAVIKNAGEVEDSFDLSLQSTPSLSEGTQQFSIPAKSSVSALIPISGPEGTYKAKVVLQSRNNPFATASKSVNITILNNPIPTFTALPETPDNLIPLTKTDMTPIYILVGVIAILGIIIYRMKKK